MEGTPVSTLPPWTNARSSSVDMMTYIKLWSNGRMTESMCSRVDAKMVWTLLNRNIYEGFWLDMRDRWSYDSSRSGERRNNFTYMQEDAIPCRHNVWSVVMSHYCNTVYQRPKFQPCVVESSTCIRHHNNEGFRCTPNPKQDQSYRRISSKEPY